MQQIQTLKQAHEVLNGLMNAIIAVVYQLIYAPSPPSSPWWRWMHFHREHECSSDCLTITELNNGSHPILDVFRSITFLNQGNVTNKCHKWSCSLQRHGWLELNISEGRTTKPSSWVFKDVRWAEISPRCSSGHEHVIGHVCKHSRTQMTGGLRGRARTDTLYRFKRWSFRSSSLNPP